MKLIHKALIVLLFTGILITTISVALRLHENSLKDKRYKFDFFTVNQIKYGLLSGDNWSQQVNRIIEQKVDSFAIEGENKKILTEQLNGVLYRVFDEANAVLHKHHKKLKDRIKFKLINAFVDVDKFKAEVPHFSNAIIAELDKPKNREQLKQLLKDKISGILAVTDQDTAGEQQSVLKRYRYTNVRDFNKEIFARTSHIKEEQKQLSYILIGMLAAVLLLWIYITRVKLIYRVSFIFSVLISFATLYIGVSLPMIEVDARIARLDLHVLSSHIIFDDQVIFFQTKSIIDVVHILVTNGKADTVFVGVLIFIFSVLFPTIKLVSASIYLFIKNKSNKFICYMAFKSGKWSMADVMVVAIFMAFVGFQGILDSQLADIELHSADVNLVTTNKSNLQPGYLIFVAFVLYNLVLAEILEWISKKEKEQAKAE